MLNQELKNCILHEIRNSNLLKLSAEIQMAEMKGKDTKEIYDAYIVFAFNLESDIKEGIKAFENKYTKL